MEDAEGRILSIIEARAAILADAKGQRGVRGKITCPVCKTGELHYLVNSNGHVWAQCTTSGCMHWME